MKLMIAADLHGSAYYGNAMCRAFQREGADRLVLLGDLLYHGPRNDLPRDYDPKQVIALLNPLAGRLLCVRGNCDSEVDQMVLHMPILADYGVLLLGTRLVYLTHGHVYHRDHLPPLHPGDLLLCGHTHVPAWEAFGEDNWYLNPGSLSLPKQDSPHSYLILEEGQAVWKTLEGTPFHTVEL